MFFKSKNVRLAERVNVLLEAIWRLEKVDKFSTGEQEQYVIDMLTDELNRLLAEQNGGLNNAPKV